MLPLPMPSLVRPIDIAFTRSDIVVRVVDSRIETALVVCLNSASAALVIAASDSDTPSMEVVDLGMKLEG